MKNEKLQPSEALAKVFSPRREEAPLLSTPEIEKLLAERAMLPNPSHINVRKIIMTLSGITGLGLAAYFAFFSASHGTNGTSRTDQSHAPHSSHFAPANHELSQPAKPATVPTNNVSQLRAKPSTRGPWSAGNDQIYADLTREELARLGLVVKGDTVIAYKLPPNDTVESMELTRHSIGGGNTRRILPPGLHAPNFYPVLMTFGSGHGVAYVIEENGRTKEWGMVGDDSMNMLVRSWLESPGAPGYIPVWWTTRSIRPCDTCQEIDKMTLKVGKNFAKPIFPFYVPRMNGFTESTKDAITQLANYYCGKANKPIFQWPKNLFINADTVTAQNLLDEMDSEENTSSMIHLRSVMAHLNELVPIIVRMKSGTGAPGPNDFIFWYEPSDPLFNALPPVQAAVFRAKLNEPPHCLTAPNAVLTNAEVTYCVAAPQVVHITVSDLTGKPHISWDEGAVAGDNVSKFSTATLASGMYLVTVKSADGTERTRRIWVENAHPKGEQENNVQTPLPAIEHSLAQNSYLEIDSVALAGIGVESNSLLAAYYQVSSKPNIVDYTGVLRSWGAVLNTLDRSAVSGVAVPNFGPALVTDGLGRKRVSTTDSNGNALAADSLIPILLRDNAFDSIGATALIFWYAPTPEFLAALPDSARAIAEAMINGSGNGNQSVAAIHGAIQQAIAYPNPSRGRFSVRLTLNGSRTLTFTLRNLLGQQVEPPTEAHLNGESDQQLDFTSAAEGVYLLDITSDRGERYLQRIVIAR